MDPSLENARRVQAQIPAGGLFAGQEWRISPAPFPLDGKLANEFEKLGRVLLTFYRAVNLLYRQSIEGKQPSWVAEYLDKGKPAELIRLQRSASFKNDVPRVIRPDILLTPNGFVIAELDSVPGGIGLTGWLNQTYCALTNPGNIIGGPAGMLEGFSRIFGTAQNVHIVVSEEAATYRPEMLWLAEHIADRRLFVHDAKFDTPADGDAIYRFFELFDLPNVPSAQALFHGAEEKQIKLTPPPKPIFEEKMLFALLWNRNLWPFWKRELGESFFTKLRGVVPYSWVIDPSPLPPHGAIPEINLTDWQQLKTLSQKERDLILKISGFSEHAWGARGVYLGSDLSHDEWSAVVEKALGSFNDSPYVLQRYEHSRLVDAQYLDLSTDTIKPMAGRVRLCPYYFVHGEAEAARANLGGILATICPADKKIIHGMKDAILAPCSVV